MGQAVEVYTVRLMVGLTSDSKHAAAFAYCALAKAAVARMTAPSGRKVMGVLFKLLCVSD